MSNVQRLAAIGAATVLLAGCGSGDEPAKTSEPKVAISSVAPSPSPSAEPSNGGQAARLKAFVGAGQAQIPALKRRFKGVYADIKIEAVQPGTLRYTYVYARQLDRAATTTELKKQASTLQASCDATLFPAMAKSGITQDPRVRYVFQNADKSPIWSYTCMPK